MQTADDEMSSAYKPPDPKKTLSARVPQSVHSKLGAILRIWQERAKASGDEAEEIDLTYVVSALLAKVTDEELQQWGGLPTTDESWRVVLRNIREASKQ